MKYPNSKKYDNIADLFEYLIHIISDDDTVLGSISYVSESNTIALICYENDMKTKFKDYFQNLSDAIDKFIEVEENPESNQ